MQHLTDQQRQAVTARGVSIALSAGAGCGKTTVLTKRFLAESQPEGNVKGDSPIFADAKTGTVPERSRLGQIVAITFTERAAREMRDRIRRACRERLEQCPEHEADYWLGLVREMDSARISTIHSFCGSLLRAHAVEAELDPRFRVLDAAQAATLLFELTDDVLRSRLGERDEATLTLVTRYSFDRLRAMIAELLAARQEIDWRMWQRETPEGLVSRWQDFWSRDTLPRLLCQVAESADAKTLLDLAGRYPPNHPVMRERCDKLRELLPRLCGAGVSPASETAGETPALQELLAAIRENAKVQGGGTKKHWATEEVYEQFKEAAKRLRDRIDKLQPQVQFDPLAARPAAELSLQAIGLAADVAGQYDRRKSELGMLDFDDLLIRARDLLVGRGTEEVAEETPRRPSDENSAAFAERKATITQTPPSPSAELRKRLAGQLRLLLVDEFQDTDPLQVELVKALCDNEYLHGKLFFVGDYKQSIYRFRGADPAVFRQLRDEIPPAGRMPLSVNFRSRPAILDFVNTLFCEEMGEDYEPLQSPREEPGVGAAVEFLWAVGSGQSAVGSGEWAVGSGEGGRSQSAIDNQQSSIASPLSPLTSPLDDMGRRERLLRIEADWIARRIRNMLEAAEREEGEKIIWDKEAGALRAVRPGDFALLFRALTNVEYYEEALRRYGIDYYLVGGHAFYSQQEVYDLLNLLRAIDVPADEVSLLGVLRSPMFALDDETLFWLSRHSDGRGKGLAAGLFQRGKLPNELDDRQRQLAAFAAATIGDLREVKDRLPVAGLIQEAMMRTGYDAMLLAEFLGERKLANLQKLVEQARSFDRAGIFTLSDFIAQLSEFVARQPDEALAATRPELNDVVKLMSIHQSKGLEFPVVIVPDVGRPRRVAGPAIGFSPQLGPVLKDENATTGYDLLMAAENDEERQEIGRLLYVATTRAADYLILSAGVEEPGKAAGPWMELLAKRFDLKTGAAKEGETRRRREGETGRQGDGAMVRVTTAEPLVRSKPVDLRRRRDLLKIVAKAEQMAADGQGKRPHYLMPVPRDAAARRQYSFSRLTGALHAETAAIDVSPLESDAAGPPPLDPRSLGTLVHVVLEEVDFARPGDVAERVRRLAEQHLSGPERQREEARAVEMIERFVASPRAAQIAAAKETFRELEFLLAWPPLCAAGQTLLSAGNVAPQEADKNVRPTAPLYLQGFIDCLYRDGNGWRLIDYKTNRATAETLAATAAAYEMQMFVYALAAETILKSPPLELTLCFLRPGLEYHFDWNAAARGHVVELVERALP
jgi:ATP-dependent helicase/nuclease subunit A